MSLYFLLLTDELMSLLDIISREDDNNEADGYDNDVDDVVYD